MRLCSSQNVPANAGISVMRTLLRTNVIGLTTTSVLLASCVRMGGPDDMRLVTSGAVSVFATKQQSTAPSFGNRLAVLEPDARVPVLDCIDEGGYSIYKIRLSDGRTGFVNDGDYRLQDKNYSDSAWCGSKPRNPQWSIGQTPVLWATNRAHVQSSAIYLRPRTFTSTFRETGLPVTTRATCPLSTGRRTHHPFDPTWSSFALSANLPSQSGLPRSVSSGSR